MRFQVHHFIPLEPWSCKKIKGKRRQMKIDGSNDGPIVSESVSKSLLNHADDTINC